MGMVFCPTSFPFVLLSSSWVISSTAAYVAALAAVFLMGASRQLLSTARSRVVAANAPYMKTFGGNSEPLLLQGVGGGGARAVPWLACTCLRRSPLALLAVDTLLYAAAMALGYINMLVAMAYDAGLLVALVAGEACAYFALRVVQTGSTHGVVHSDAAAEAPCCE